MSIETVRQFFAEHAPEVAIEELETSTATVQLAAGLTVSPLGRLRKHWRLK